MTTYDNPSVPFMISTLQNANLLWMYIEDRNKGDQVRKTQVTSNLSITILYGIWSFYTVERYYEFPFSSLLRSWSFYLSIAIRFQIFKQLCFALFKFLLSLIQCLNYKIKIKICRILKTVFSKKKKRRRILKPVLTLRSILSDPYVVLEVWSILVERFMLKYISGPCNSMPFWFSSLQNVFVLFFHP